MFLEQTINKENSSQHYYKLNEVKLLQKNYESKFNFSQVKFTSKLLSLRDASFFLSNFRAVPNVSENRPVSDIQIHDEKLAAAMKAHNIQNLLTFNTKDWTRYTDIKAIEPKDV